MKLSLRRIGCAVAFGASVSGVAFALASQPGGFHSIVAADEVRWQSLRPGAEIAVVSGDPDKEGSHFVLRFRYRGRSRIPPHWHPTDEHLTVLSGTFKLGMGEGADESKTTTLTQGAYAFLPAKMAHYAWTDGDTTIQAHGVGPFVINYVNAEDDPKRSGRQ